MNKLRDPEWFVPEMAIVDRHGKHTTLGKAGIFWSQEQFMRSFASNKRLLILKSRQLGITTIAAACMLHKALLSKDQYNVLTMTHEGEAVGRVNGMLRHYIQGLPKAIRPGLATDNMRALEFAHNGSMLRQVMAGGRSQGRSFTYQALHATEMAFWPSGSAARGGMAVDEEVWSSILATLHESPETRVVIESTADGPSGIFHKMCMVAQQSPDWDFLFFPWFRDPSYMRPLSEKWERREDEQEMVDLYGVSDEQLCWRRWKIEEQGYSLRRFQQEYPSNPAEPFILSTGAWFDNENLSRIAALLPPSEFSVRDDGLRVWLEPEPYYRYYIGVDPSGGTGGDAGVVQVIREDMVQVAKFASRFTSPTRLAEEAAQLSARYNKAPILVEYNNKYGNACWERLSRLGCKLWTDKNSRPWTTTKATKMKLVDYARSVVDDGFVTFHDPATVQECMHFREQDNGDVCADSGYKDDHVMSFAMACWNARRSFQKFNDGSTDKHIEKQRRKRHSELGITQ